MTSTAASAASAACARFAADRVRCASAELDVELVAFASFGIWQLAFGKARFAVIARDDDTALLHAAALSRTPNWTDAAMSNRAVRRYAQHRCRTDADRPLPATISRATMHARRL